MTAKIVQDYLRSRKKWVRGLPLVESPRVKLTQALVDGLPTESFDYELRDTEQPGLRCRVRNNGTKSFIVFRRPKGGGKPVSITLCKFGELPVKAQGQRDDVRKRAGIVLGEYLDGKSPVVERLARQAEEDAVSITLGEALEQYLENKRIKPTTARDYKGSITKHLDTWLSLPLSRITPTMVRERHKDMSKAHPIGANNVMRYFRAIYNNVRDELADARGDALLPECPTRSLKRTWNKETRRQGQVEPEELAAWFAAVQALPETLKGAGADGELARDYLQFVILTGLRRREATGLSWRNINLKVGTFEVTDTKNGIPLKLPLSDYLLEILERRYKATNGKGGPFLLDEPRRFVMRVREESGVMFTIHDLRRSFIGYCEDCDLGFLTIKALVNHSTGGSGGDVTAGYHIASHRRMREPMQRVTDYVLGHAGIRESNVVSMGSSK